MNSDSGNCLDVLQTSPKDHSDVKRRTMTFPTPCILAVCRLYALTAVSPRVWSLKVFLSVVLLTEKQTLFIPECFFYPQWLEKYNGMYCLYDILISQLNKIITLSDIIMLLLFTSNHPSIYFLAAYSEVMEGPGAPARQHGAWDGGGHPYMEH